MNNWPKIKLNRQKEYNHCFGCGKSNPIGLKLVFGWDEKKRTVSADFTPGENLQGWSGYLHGGITACVLDEAMGWAAMSAGYDNLTAKMQVRFREMIPIGNTYHVSCTITRESPRLLETSAILTDRDGKILAEATSTQFVVGPWEEKGGNIPKNEVRAILWDMDGVIADTAEQHCWSWQQAFKTRGVDFTAEDFQRIFGQRNDTIIRKTLGRDLTQAKIDEIAKIKEEYFRQIVRQNLKPFPGVINLLKILKENGILAAVASSAPPENIRLILDGLGIEGYFQAIVYGREVTEGKPSPQVFLLAAQKLGVEPRNCIVIEDAVAGVTAAKKAGMHCIAVTNTHPANSLAEADTVVDTLEKINIKDLNGLFNARSR